MAQLTLYPGDFPVSPSAAQVREEGGMMTAFSGRKLCALLETSDPAGCYLKTLLGFSTFWNPKVSLKWKSKRLTFFVRTSHAKRIRLSSDYSEESLEQSLQKLGQLDILFPLLTTAAQSFCVFQLAPWEHLTVETGYGLLPTPLATAIEEPVAQWLKRTSQPGKERNPPLQIIAALNEILKGRLIPTPTAIDSTGATARMKSTATKPGSMHAMTLSRIIALIPTPTATDAKGSTTQRGLVRKDGQLRTDQLRNIPAMTGQAGQLNPRFVAEMMGFPPDWTISPFQNGAKKAYTPMATP